MRRGVTQKTHLLFGDRGVASVYVPEPLLLHCEDERILVLEITVDRPDTNADLAREIPHRHPVEPEPRYQSLEAREDLVASGRMTHLNNSGKCSCSAWVRPVRGSLEKPGRPTTFIGGQNSVAVN